MECARPPAVAGALLGPAHQAHVPGLALPAAGAYATPLGEVPLDRAACARLDGLPSVVRSGFALIGFGSEADAPVATKAMKPAARERRS